MKKLIFTLISALGLILLNVTAPHCQEFYVEKIHDTGYEYLHNIFVAGEEILIFSNNQGLYYDGNSWNETNYIQNHLLPGQIDGFKKNDGNIFAVFVGTYLIYLWNNDSKAWDPYPKVKNIESLFAYSEDKVYFCTTRGNGLNYSALYSWSAEEGFVELTTIANCDFYGLYVIEENEILLVGTYFRDNGEPESINLFRYDGESLTNITSLDISRSGPRGIYSIDSRFFFVPTFNGYLYRWDNQNSQLEKIFTQDCEDMRIIVKDNNNIFINSNLGLQHLKIQSSEIKSLLYNGNTVYAVNSFREKGTGRIFFPDFLDGKIFEIKSYNSIEENNPLSEVKIYPNPVSNNIYLQLADDLTLSGEGEIYDIAGHKIMSFSLNNQENIDVSDLLPGIYFLKIQNPTGKQIVEKFIKK